MMKKFYILNSKLEFFFIESNRVIGIDGFWKVGNAVMKNKTNNNRKKLVKIC